MLFLLMHLLICAATPFEIEPTARFLEKQSIRQAEILVTGVGMMATTYALTRYIGEKRPACILQAGIGGTFQASGKLGAVVAVEDEMIGDLGVTEDGSFRSVFHMRLQEPDAFPWNNGRLKNHHELLRSCGLERVHGVTVNEVSTDINKISYYRDQLGAGIESMEGAALHYVALQEKIPFLQLRAVSNFAGERDKTLWDMETSLVRLNHELQRIILKILNP